MDIPSVHTYASLAKIPTEIQDTVIIHEGQKKREKDLTFIFLLSELQEHNFQWKPNTEINIHSYGANKISKKNCIRKENGSTKSQDKKSKCFWVFDRPTIRPTMKIDKNIPLVHT